VAYPSILFILVLVVFVSIGLVVLGGWAVYTRPVCLQCHVHTHRVIFNPHVGSKNDLLGITSKKVKEEYG